MPIVPAAVHLRPRCSARAAAPDAAADGAARAGRAARRAGRRRGRVGAGTGATVGKLDGARGLRAGRPRRRRRSTSAGGARVAALAVVNAFGDVLGADGAVLAGLGATAGFVGTEAALVAASPARPSGAGDDARLRGHRRHARQARLRCGWPRAAHAGIARATAPAATALDGDVAFAVATGDASGGAALALEAAAAMVVAAAVRDARPGGRKPFPTVLR